MSDQNTPDAARAGLRGTHLGNTALSPISYLIRSARVWADRPALHKDGQARTYAELLQQVSSVAGALRARGVTEGARVAVLLPNVPEMLELHFAVPGIGAVLVPLNTRLTESELAAALRHSGASLLVAHHSLESKARGAVALLDRNVALSIVGGRSGGVNDYECWNADTIPSPIAEPADEMSLLSINYTSGTTGSPKGVMYTHRGAYLHTLGVIVEAGLDSTSNYLWTLPMFHCHGWSYPWAVTAMGARHVFLATFEPDVVWDLLGTADITHLCAAPTVITMLLESDEARQISTPVRAFVGGAPPSPALLRRGNELGLEITQLYGLTETYGPWSCAPISHPGTRSAMRSGLGGRPDRGCRQS